MFVTAAEKLMTTRTADLPYLNRRPPPEAQSTIGDLIAKQVDRKHHAHVGTSYCPGETRSHQVTDGEQFVS